jgi:hypothetical protein
MIAIMAISLASVIVLAAAGVLGYRRVRQRRTARTLVIGAANGIAESGTSGPAASTSGSRSGERTAPTRSCCSCTAPA